MCVFFNETYIPVYRKMVSSEIRDFFEGPFLCVTAHRETKL